MNSDGSAKASHCFKAKSVNASWRHMASNVCPMLNHSDIYNISEPITIVIFNESLQTFAYILPVGQCTPDKNVTYVSDIMPRQ